MRRLSKPGVTGARRRADLEKPPLLGICCGSSKTTFSGER